MEQESFANRLSKALIIRDMKPIDLAKKSGINKATISEYLAGKYNAKQNNIYLLAKALNVNEAWLMGFDTSIDRTPDNKRSQIMTYTANDDSMLPLLGINDIAYILPQDTYNSGDTIYFKLSNKNMIRKVVKQKEFVEFHAMNPYYPILKYSYKELKEKEFIVIGRVIKVINESAFK